MPKRPKPSASGREATRNSRPAQAADPRSRTDLPRQDFSFCRYGGWIAALFACLWLGYLWLFYSDSTLLRFQSLPLLVTPEIVPAVLWSIWTGGEPEHVAIADRLPVFAIAGCVLAAGYLLGHALLVPLQLRRWTTRLERFVLRAGAGMNLLSLYTLAVGLAGGLQQPVWFLVAVLAGGVATATDVVRAHWLPTMAPSPPPIAETPRENTPFGRWGWLLIIPFAVAYLWVATQPPWEFDVREYHLQVPKEWYQQGRIGFVDHNVYGNMPLGAEMHVLLSMIWMPGSPDWWYGALAGKVVIASFSLLTALALITAGRRFVCPAAGVFAAVLYLSVPWLFHISTVGLIEGVYAFYFWVAVSSLWWWNQQQTGKVAPLVLAGFFAGAAAACKYTAVLFVLIPLTLWILLAASSVATSSVAASSVGPGTRRRLSSTGWVWKGRLASAAVFAAAALAGCGLWYGKNLILTGNPVFPLAYSIFGGAGWDPETNEQWTQAHAVPRDEQGRRYTLPKAVASVERLFWRSDWLSPILVPFFLLGLAVAISKYFGLLRDTRRLVAYLACWWALVLLLWWLVTHRFDRFLIPILPMVAFVGAIGGTWSLARPWVYVSRSILVIGSLLSFLVMALGLTGGDRRFLHALEHQRIEQPVIEEHNVFFARTHPAHRFLNEIVPSGYRVLLVGDAQAFDLEPPVLYNTCFDDCWFEVMMKGRTARERRQILKDYRISHIFVHWDEIRRYREPSNYGYTDYVQQEVFDELVRQGILRELTVEVTGVRLRPTSGQVFEVVGHESWK